MKKLLLTLISILWIKVLCYSQPNDCVAHWPLDGNANDVSGHSKNGIINGPVFSSDRFDNPQGAFYFDGINDYIEIPNNVLSSSNAFSISLWVYITGDSPNEVFNEQVLFDLRGQYNITFDWVEADDANHPNSIRFYTNSGGVGKEIYSANNSVVANAWYHVVAAYGNNQMKLYINNVEVGSISQNPPSALSGFKSLIGKDYSLSTNRLWLFGKIDEIRVYERLLTNNEIQQLYWGGSTGATNLWQQNGSNIFYNSGRVGIGTDDPDFELTVAGKIKSREVKVEANAGADFVFENNYELMSLDELEKYINIEKHLPEVASEKEMKEKGLNISEFQIKLLQKIEELTLYTIEQNKKIEQQNAKIQALEVKIANLEADSK